MASRSFKPASYLASAAQQPSRSPRPAFTRSSSASSVLSTKSDDSLTARLYALSTTDRGEKDTAGGPESPSAAAPNTSSRRLELEDSQGRKKSQPIAIEPPRSRQPAAYTPLSARGDLPGGYFPHHEELNKSYKNRPSFFAHLDHNRHSLASSTASSPSGLSNTSSALPSPADATTKPPAMLTSPFSPPDPLNLTIPMGKYHPAIYKSPDATPAGPSAISSVTNLAIPTSSSQRNRKQKHDRRTSDVTKKLHEYQREMIAQARLASQAAAKKTSRAGDVTPVSPKLEPLGSPGPITPFELEAMEEGAGWLGLERADVRKGQRKRGSSLIARGMRAESLRRGASDGEDVEQEGAERGRRPVN